MKYDVVIIGSGPGGYVGAIRCAQLGLKTALIEKYSTLGGTCLNVGCIPSKALLDSSEHFFNAAHNFEKHGIEINSPKVNMHQMIARKAEVVKQTCDGIQYLMDKNKIDVHTGVGSFISKNEIKVTGADGKETVLEAKNVIIATGSKPNFFPGMEPDKDRIITSTEMLNLEKVAQNLIVIGGGVIGLELGSVHARLGANVNVIEFADSILPTMDKSISKEMTKVLKKEGFKFNFNHRVQKVENTGNGVKVTALDKAGKEVVFEDGTTETYDVIVYATGYKATFPFLKDKAFDVSTTNEFRLYKKVIHPDWPNLYFVGLIQPLGAIMPLAETQAKWVAKLIKGTCCLPDVSSMKKDIERDTQQMRHRYNASPRHTFQVDFYLYKETIERELIKGTRRATKTQRLSPKT